MFDDDFAETYAEWADSDLIWGKGMYNWRRANSKEEWEKPPMFKYDDDDFEHPLCTFGYARKD